MPVLANVSNPEKEVVQLRLPAFNLEVNSWTHYTIDSEFLTPSDGWELAMPNEGLRDDVRKALGMVGPTRSLGTEIALIINGNVQASGFLDSLEITTSRNGGAEWKIGGRDRLAQVVDSHIDPTTQFKEGTSLADFLKALFAPFGWGSDDSFEIDNSANRNAKTGIRGIPTTKGGKKKGPKPLKSYIQHQLKPYPHEGVFAFASRVAQRHGLWIWLSADGKKLIVSKPDFDQEPSYFLRRISNNETNVLSGSVRFDMIDQPTIIVADGFGGGGEFGKSRLRSIASNPAFYTDDVAYQEPFKKYKDAHRLVDFEAVGTPQKLPRNRAIYLHDDESKTQEQLDNFVRREMSLLLRKSLVVDYVVEGHGQVVDGDFRPFDVDTVALVEDELAGVKEKMWVIRRTFEKGRDSGTTTRLQLVRLNSIQF